MYIIALEHWALDLAVVSRRSINLKTAKTLSHIAPRPRSDETDRLLIKHL